MLIAPVNPPYSMPSVNAVLWTPTPAVTLTKTILITDAATGIRRLAVGVALGKKTLQINLHVLGF